MHSQEPQAQSPAWCGAWANFHLLIASWKLGYWGREWDSNPRYLAVRLISSQVHSATLPSLRCLKRQIVSADLTCSWHPAALAGRPKSPALAPPPPAAIA